MNTVPVAYPATPKFVDEKVIQPSAAFKQEVVKVLAAIGFFIVVYIALMAVAILLALLCGYGGIMLIIAYPKFFTLMIGLGLIGLGGMVIFFLLKFLFKSNKTDRSHLIQITEEEQPELFAFVRRITAETQSPFPKKIYISPDVNACVFYDSNFWSMFFPVRKNLQIGLGLVNAVNLSEFKAILAHEFGHFSQRSMKLGSYVYNVNQVIYNMLYDNTGYSRTLEGWAGISDYFSIFAGITIWIVKGIQWILQGVYSIVNKSYLSLSRQMEFHADAVAAYVSGADHLITSLRRLEVADSCYNQLFNHYNEWFHLNLKPDNLYPQHTQVMKQFAEDLGLPVAHGLPQVGAGSFAHFNRARVIVKDQWASHPSTDDREDHLNRLNIHTDAVYDSAWTVFTNAVALQQQLTEKVYSNTTFSNPPETLDIKLFQKHFQENLSKHALNKKYKGFYNARDITTIDLDEISKEAAIENSKNLDDILNEATLELPFKVDGLKGDIHTLEMIDKGSMPVKTFEFDGVKYSSDDIPVLIPRLQDELKQTEEELAAADKRLIAFFMKHADQPGQREEIFEDYKRMFADFQERSDDFKKYVDIRGIINPLFYENMPIEKAVAITNQVKHNEKPIKKRIQEMLADTSYTMHCTPDEIAKLQEYSAKDHEYFSQGTFLQRQLTLFNESVQLYQYMANERSFALKKDLLEKQLRFLS